MSAARRGRPAACPREIVRRMYEMHYGRRMSYQQIAVLLNEEGVPLPMGGLGWRKSYVVRVMYSNYGKAIGRDVGFCA